MSSTPVNSPVSLEAVARRFGLDEPPADWVRHVPAEVLRAPPILDATAIERSAHGPPVRRGEQPTN